MDVESSGHDKLESTLQESSEPCNLSLEYLRKITNDFSSELLLGEGGFGKVYKGLLQNGKLVAVKKLGQLKPGVQEKQFENEVYHLMRLKHPNIVRFLGYCYETQNECLNFNGKYIFAEKQQRLLCFEYLSNGSLDRHLSDESSGLDWETRYKIIKGICCAIHYLHEGCQSQINGSIIHLDLKPANILLDDNMTPKVADFGLSRLFHDKKSQTWTTNLAGSIGYMAPEYIYRHVITTKADIFCLGTIIIEIITGDRIDPFSVNITSCQDFVENVLGRWRNRLKDAMSETDCEQIKCCLEVGIRCVNVQPKERPTAQEIIKVLRWESKNCHASYVHKPPEDKEFFHSTEDTEKDRETKHVTSSGTTDSFGTGNTISPCKNAVESSYPFAIKGFTFSAVNCWRTSKKLVCCQFSSDGKILASAGHEKKAVIWNLEAFETQYTSEEHAFIITDVSFRPNSTQLATSSFDKTIKLWNAADPEKSLYTFTGHHDSIYSLDFHPKKTDLLCSCDCGGKILYWNVTQLTCERRITKAESFHVRFQPNAGRFLATSNANVVSIFDIETDDEIYTLQGHGTSVHSLCWDNSGEHIATVSSELIKVWSISSGECIHELTANGNKFYSCVFHPGYTDLLIIGCDKTLEIWNMVKKQSFTVQAHKGLIATLAQSPVNGIVASASHDYSVKLWK